MKPKPWILPLIALIAVGLYWNYQRASITSLAERTDTLRASIAASQATAPPPRKLAPSVKPAEAPKKIDWKNLLHQMGRDPATLGRIEEILETMTSEEIFAELKSIRTLGLPEGYEGAGVLEELIISPLIKKNPEMALTWFASHYQQGADINFELNYALQRWANKDPKKALAWFQREVAAGHFDSKSLDGKNQVRMMIEGSLISTFLASDTDAAARLLGGIPADQRSQILQGQSIQPENQAAFAALVRSQVSAENQAATIAGQGAHHVFNGGYDEVTEFLTRIKATPEERLACVQEVGNSSIQKNSSSEKITPAAVETLRDWITASAPAAADGILGNVLANSGQGMGRLPFSDAADYAVHFSKTSGNDAVLATFLKSPLTNFHKQEAAIYAGKISDAKLREEILRLLD